MINMDADMEEKDYCDIMDNINVLSINNPQPPLCMKRTKSNSLYNKQNLEEEKIEDDPFSNT